MREIFDDKIEIPIKVFKTTDDSLTHFFIECKDSEAFGGIHGSGETLEKSKVELLKSLKVMMLFYRQDSKRLNKRAIFLGNFSRNGEYGWQLWFRIIGLGLTINRHHRISKSSLEGHEFPGFWLGKFQFFFHNAWKWE